MKTKTKSELVSENSLLSRDAGILHCALNDLINGRVTWFRERAHRLGLSREAGPEGGLVIHRYSHAEGTDYSSAYQWEDWWPGVRDSIPAQTNPDGMALRNVAILAHDYIVRKQAEKH